MKLKTKVASAIAAAVEKFIDMARSAKPFGDVKWDDVEWVVPNKGRASDGRKTERIWFNSAFVNKSTRANAIAFPRPFGDFVKAYACHIEKRNPKGLSTIYHTAQVRAFRYLHEAFGKTRENPWELRSIHFDMAIGACQQREERSSAYRIGVALAAIANTMDTYRLCEVRLNWVNPIRREAADGGSHQLKVAKESTDRRNRKLPTEQVVNAICTIANHEGLADYDLVRQRALELFFCGGFRPTEELTLPAACWVTEPQYDEHKQPMVGPGGKQIVHCGIRCVPGKRGHEDSQIKWLPTVIVDVAKRAIDDITRFSEPFRNVARFMASHPGRTLLPEPWHSLPGDELLSLEDVRSAVGLSGSELDNIRTYLKEAGVTIVASQQNGKKVRSVSKWELERFLVTRSGRETVYPRDEAHYRLEDCLFVFPINFFHTTRPTYNGTATLMTYGQLRDYLVGRKGVKSIFERLGYRDEKGRPLKITAYQLRHWLDTMAEDGGMSQIEIARHFGRKDIGHNSAYNQMTGLQLAQSVHEKRMNGKTQGPVTDAALKIKDPRRKAEFVASASVTAHMTDIGVCEHNWAASPCPNGRNCIACDEHTLEKGNKEHISRTEELKRNHEELIRLAEKEKEDGTVGVDNWLEFQKLVVKRATIALVVHKNASIPDGTLVELPSLESRDDAEEELV